ncbi:MAG TPA: hypothetical protein VJV78_39295 [Polyangiales bacterium]|nr:hypothetical protein [Polyangiales bacterium]
MTLVLEVQQIVSSKADFLIRVGTSDPGTAVLGTLTLTVAGTSRQFALRIGSTLSPQADSQQVALGAELGCTVTQWGDGPSKAELIVKLTASGSAESRTARIA